MSRAGEPKARGNMRREFRKADYHTVVKPGWKGKIFDDEMKRIMNEVCEERGWTPVGFKKSTGNTDMFEIFFNLKDTVQIMKDSMKWK